MTYPQTLLGNKVEIFYDAAWHDITSDVRGLGAEDGEITIEQRGQPDESSGLTATTAELSINNQNGKYSPRNSASELYGKIGPNTPLRISTDLSDTSDVTTLNVTHTHTAAGQTKETNTATIITDFDITLTGVLLDAAPLTDAMTVSISGRVDDLVVMTDYVRARLIFQAAGIVQIALDTRIDGVTTSTSATIVSGVAVTDSVNMRFQAIGRTIRVRAWENGTTEPTTWGQSTTTGHLTSGALTVRSAIGSLSTNTFPFDITYDSIFYSLGIIMMTGEIAEFPKKWDSTGSDVWVTLQVNGLTRRLLQGSRKLLGSPLLRALQRTDLIGYWSFENMTGNQFNNQVVASSLPNGGSTLVSTGPSGLGGPADPNQFAIKWGDATDLMGSDPLPTVEMASQNLSFIAFTGGTFSAANSANDQYSTSFWMHTVLPGDLTTNARASAAVNLELTPAARFDRMQCGVVQEFISSIPLYQMLVFFQADDGAVINVTYSVDYVNAWRFFRFTVDRFSVNEMRVQAFVDEVLVGSSTINTGAAAVVGQPVRMTPDFGVDTDSSSAPMSFGHLAVASGSGGDDIELRADTIYDAGALAHAGETAVARMERLCSEENVTLEVTEHPEDPGTLLGPQRNVTFVHALDNIALADDGVLYELRAEFGYGYRTRMSLYLAETMLELDYTNTDLSEVPETTDDDQRTVNQFTAVRESVGGEGVTVVQSTGPLSTADPRADPPGVGPYPDEETVNVLEHDQLADYAGWRVHLGTWDESRWPGVATAMHRTPFSGNRAKLAAAAFLDIAEIFTIVNTPTWVGQDSVILQMRSVSVFLSNYTWGFEWTAVPAGPYTDLSTLDNTTYGRLDTSGSELVSAIDTNDTELIVWTPESDLPLTGALWTEDIGELNFAGAVGIDLRFNPPSRVGGRGGERVRIPATATRTDTFTRSGQLSGSNADSGQTWVHTSGTASNATTDGTRAVFLHSAAGTTLWQTLPGPGPDQLLNVDIAFNTGATTGGAYLKAAAILRQTDTNNYVDIQVVLPAGGTNTATLSVRKIVGGVATILSSVDVSYSLAYTANAIIKLKAMVYRRDVYAKFWLATATEPDWTIALPNALANLISGSDIALFSERFTGNTNVNATMYFDNLTVITPKIRPYASDMFGRSVSAGFGTADVGGAWSNLIFGGVAADLDVVNPAATTTHTVANTQLGGFLDDIDLTDVTVSHVLSLSALPTGASLSSSILLRGNSGPVAIVCRTSVTTSTFNHALTISIAAADGTSLATETLGLFYTAAAQFRIKAAAMGTTIMMKVWNAALNEPTDWQLVVEDTTTDPIAGWVGFLNERVTGNTNANAVISVYDWRVMNPQRMTVERSINSIEKTWPVGNDIRLWSPAVIGR